MNNLLTLNYWFALRPEMLQSLGQKLFIGLIIGLIILTALLGIVKRGGGIYRLFFRQLYNFGWANIVIGLLFLFFNLESVPFFAARFWLGLWLIEMIVWLVFIFKDLKKIPEKKRQLAKDQEFQKYIP